MTRRSFRRAGAVLALLALLSACGRGSVDASQVLASVNGDEVTVHQLDLVLVRARQNNPSDKEREALIDQLINRQLLFQQAQKLELDRRPEVMSKLEDMRLEIMAAAYANELAAKLPEPADTEVTAYFKNHPALFSERRLYRLREVSIPDGQKANAPQLGQIEERLNRKERLADVLGWLGRQPGRFYEQLRMTPAEDLPVDVADRLLVLKVGDILPVRRDGGLLIYEVQGYEAAPMGWKAASQVIKKYLAREALNRAVNEEINRLRGSAKLSRTPAAGK